MNLESLGFSPSFAEAFRVVPGDGLVPGRVAAGHTHVYRVFTESSEIPLKSFQRCRTKSDLYDSKTKSEEVRLRFSYSMVSACSCGNRWL